jgi:TIR domain
VRRAIRWLVALGGGFVVLVSTCAALSLVFNVEISDALTVATFVGGGVLVPLGAWAERADRGVSLGPVKPEDPIGGPFVFLCHSHSDDHTYVERLATFLSGLGFAVWYDSHLTTGEQWADVIQSKIDSCVAFVPLMTERAERSAWVKREIARAELKRKPILPLLVSGEVFFGLSDLHYEDVRSQRLPSDAFVRRLGDLVGVVGAVAEGHMRPSPVDTENTTGTGHASSDTDSPVTAGDTVPAAPMVPHGRRIGLTVSLLLLTAALGLFTFNGDHPLTAGGLAGSPSLSPTSAAPGSPKPSPALEGRPESIVLLNDAGFGKFAIAWMPYLGECFVGEKPDNQIHCDLKGPGDYMSLELYRYDRDGRGLSRSQVMACRKDKGSPPSVKPNLVQLSAGKGSYCEWGNRLVDEHGTLVAVEVGISWADSKEPLVGRITRSYSSRPFADPSFVLPDSAIEEIRALWQTYGQH